MLKLFVKMQHIVNSMMKDESGQDLIEYTLIGALIAVACVASMSTLAGAIKTELDTISAQL